MKTIDIVLPVYNEEEGLRAFHTQLMHVLDSLSSQLPIQDDLRSGSIRDRSLEVLRELAAASPSVMVLHLSRRFGHQMSLIAGMDHASGNAVIMMDCDLQHPPEVIPELLRRFEEGFEVVHTLRDLQSACRVPQALYFVCSTNYRTGCRRLKSRKGRRISASSPLGWPPSSASRSASRTSSCVGYSSGLDSARQRYHLSARRGPPERPSDRPFLLFAFAITGIVSFSKCPLRLATLMGFAMATLSAMYGAWLVMKYFVGGYFPPGFASLILVLLATSGLQLMFLGIVGEYPRERIRRSQAPPALRHRRDYRGRIALSTRQCLVCGETLAESRHARSAGVRCLLLHYSRPDGVRR